jgi:threonine/homoserine/homoserine lactone efflux protein
LLVVISKPSIRETRSPHRPAGSTLVAMTLPAPTPGQWLAFVVASALFIQLPGPSLLFTIGRALTVGRRDALLSVCGNALGIVTQVVAVAVGLGAVVAASASAYAVLKLAGAAYVVWLGVQAIRHRADARVALEAVTAGDVVPDEVRSRAGHSLRVGFLVGVTNPKTIVFFVAFLPQFVNEAAGHAGLQLVLLGLLFGVMCVMSDSVWALAAAKARDWFARRPKRLDKLGAAGGVMMIGLGVTMSTVD